MKFKEYSIQHPFHLTQFLIPKVGAVVELQEGETREDAAKRLFEEMAFLENEYRKFVGASLNAGYELVDRNHPLPIVQAEEVAPKDSKPKNTVEVISANLRACKSIGELRTWKVLAESNSVLKEVYKQTELELTKSETVTT